MKPIAPEFTHRGWLLFCPVYLSNVDSDDEFDFVQRRFVPEWWLHLQLDIFEAYARRVARLGATRVPELPLRVASEIRR